MLSFWIPVISRFPESRSDLLHVLERLRDLWWILTRPYVYVTLCNYIVIIVSLLMQAMNIHKHTYYIIWVCSIKIISPIVLHIFQHERQWKIDIPRPLESTQANTWLNASSCCAQPQNYAVQRGGGSWWMMVNDWEEATNMGEHRV